MRAIIIENKTSKEDQKNSISRKKWTEEEINRVIELRRFGIPFKKISNRFHLRTPNSVRKALSRYFHKKAELDQSLRNNNIMNVSIRDIHVMARKNRIKTRNRTPISLLNNINNLRNYKGLPLLKLT